MSGKGKSIISLFSGALGLDLGLERAGFTVKVAVERDKNAAETIRRNRPDIRVIERPIEDVSTDEILAAAGLERGEPAIVSAGPSCQAFSTAGQRESIGDPLSRGVMFRHFLRVVRESRPRFFVMENVRGILSAAIRHRPLKERQFGYPPLLPEEELGSAFMMILKEFERLRYYTVFDLLNAADFGVPQCRERVIFIGSRDGEILTMPEPTHAPIDKDSVLPHPTFQKWVTLAEGLNGLVDPNPLYKDFTPARLKYLRLIPEGGNWRSLPKRMQAMALGSAYSSWGGRSGFFRRLSWDRPAPSLTTNPDTKATMLCHPTELRPLSIREYARIQQFPDTWEFCGSLNQRYIQIGNAVPIGLGEAIGNMIRKVMRKRSPQRLKGTVVCTSTSLIKRLSKRPRTMMNPARMRKVKAQSAAKEWLNGREGKRIEILPYAMGGQNGKCQTQAKTPISEIKKTRLNVRLS